MVVEERGVWSEAIRDVLDAEDAVEVRGEVASDADIPDAVARTSADVVVGLTHDPQAMTDGCRKLLARFPRLRVLAVRDGRKASVWRMRPTRRRVGELSLERFVREVRGER